MPATDGETAYVIAHRASEANTELATYLELVVIPVLRLSDPELRTFREWQMEKERAKYSPDLAERLAHQLVRHQEMLRSMIIHRIDFTRSET